MRDLSNWGFTRNILVRVSAEGTPEVVDISENARVRQPTVYASIRDDGLALKVGITQMSLWQRWYGTIRVIGAKPGKIKLRENEWRDRDQWHQFVLGRTFTVWSKAAETTTISYADQLPEFRAPLIEAEERYIDALLEPVIGKVLSLRGKL